MNRALRAAAMGVLLLSPVALAACSAGQVSQTATQQQNLGNQADVGDLKLRALQLACSPDLTYARGDDVRLLGTVVSTGETDDTLVSVQSSAFSGVQFVEQSGSAAPTTSDTMPCPAAPSSSPASTSATAGSTVTAPATGTAAATGTSAGSTGSGNAATAAPTTTTSPGNASAGNTTSAPSGSAAPTVPAGASTSSANGRLSLPVPSDGSLLLGSADGTGPVLTLTGLNEPLMAGQFVDVTFTFQKAGTVTVQVPVGVAAAALPRGSAYDYQQTEDPKQQGGGSA